MFLLGYENNESIRMSKHARGIAIAFSTEKNWYETQGDQVKICK